VIEAEQTEEDSESERNDRLVAVPLKARTFSDCKSVKNLNDNRVAEIQQFFVSYNRIRDKKFKLLGIHGIARAEACARRGMEQFEKLRRKKPAKSRSSK
jgi:inorganic pyrophosphatase